MNINFNTIIIKALPTFIVIFIAFTLNTIILIYLPKEYVIDKEIKKYDIEYNKYNINKTFQDRKRVEKVKKVVDTKPKEYSLLSNIVLKAIYATNDDSSWVIISEKSSSKTHMLSIGEEFKNYVLKEVYSTYVFFEKNGKRYKVLLNDKNEENKLDIKTVIEDKIEQKIEKIADVYNIQKDTVKSYTKNFSKIWKEISIKEIKKDGKIDGFKINRLSNKSIFKELGLKKNDIIKSVNNVELTSYADAFKLYKKIDKLTSLKFTILRNNEELELEYEIK